MKNISRRIYLTATVARNSQESKKLDNKKPQPKKYLFLLSSYCGRELERMLTRPADGTKLLFLHCRAGPLGTGDCLWRMLESLREEGELLLRVLASSLRLKGGERRQYLLDVGWCCCCICCWGGWWLCCCMLLADVEGNVRGCICTYLGLWSYLRSISTLIESSYLEYCAAWPVLELALLNDDEVGGITVVRTSSPQNESSSWPDCHRAVVHHRQTRGHGHHLWHDTILGGQGDQLPHLWILVNVG